jgi:transposase
LQSKRKDNLSLQKDNHNLQEENHSLREENLKQAQELLYYKRLFYGRRSERRIPEHPDGQLFIPFGQESIPEETPDIKPLVEEIQVASYIRRNRACRESRKPRREEIPADIERRTRVIEPEGIDLEKMTRIGEDVREILHYIPGKFYVECIIRPVYKLRHQNPEEVSTPFYQAESIETFLSKSIAGDTLLAHLTVSKYCDHLPVYRQIEIFKRQGVKLAGSTIGGWISGVAIQLYPLYERLVKTVLSSGYIQVDESTVPVIDNEKHRAVKGYMWVVSSVRQKQVFSHYDQGSRSQRTLVPLLRDYRGAVQSDGYEAYSLYEDKAGVLLLGCWAHVRRKFESALSEDKALAGTAIDYIGLLYQIEANLKEKELPPEEISRERKRLAYPILKNFEAWMLNICDKVLPKSLMGKAISYTFSLYPRLVRYVSDGRFLIDNNRIENTIRPFALGRKNYLFCGNHDTAADTALFYSLFGCCKLAGINPYKWLLDILGRIKDCKTGELDKLLPIHWRKPE